MAASELVFDKMLLEGIINQNKARLLAIDQNWTLVLG